MKNISVDEDDECGEC